MRYWIWLALQSAISRKGALLIIVFSTAISVALLLAVLKIRDDTKTSFTNAISGVDLIVGSKGSPTELILYSVFHIGRPTSLISGKSIHRNPLRSIPSESHSAVFPLDLLRICLHFRRRSPLFREHLSLLALSFCSPIRLMGLGLSD